MNSKSMLWILVTIGGIIGGYIPALWGDNSFSMASVIFSGLGGFAGIWAWYKMRNF